MCRRVSHVSFYVSGTRPHVDALVYLSQRTGPFDRFVLWLSATPQRHSYTILRFDKSHFHCEKSTSMFFVNLHICRNLRINVCCILIHCNKYSLACMYRYNMIMKFKMYFFLYILTLASKIYSSYYFVPKCNIITFFCLQNLYGYYLLHSTLILKGPEFKVKKSPYKTF